MRINCSVNSFRSSRDFCLVIWSLSVCFEPGRNGTKVSIQPVDVRVDFAQCLIPSVVTNICVSVEEIKGLQIKQQVDHRCLNKTVKKFNESSNTLQVFMSELALAHHVPFLDLDISHTGHSFIS